AVSNPKPITMMTTPTLGSQFVPMVSSRERERLAGFGAGEGGIVPVGIVRCWSGAEAEIDGCKEPGAVTLVDIAGVTEVEGGLTGGVVGWIGAAGAGWVGAALTGKGAGGAAVAGCIGWVVTAGGGGGGGVATGFSTGGGGKGFSAAGATGFGTTSGACAGG